MPRAARLALLALALGAVILREMPAAPLPNDDARRDLALAAGCREGPSCPARGALTTVPFVFQSGAWPTHLALAQALGMAPEGVPVLVGLHLLLAFLALAAAADLAFGAAGGAAAGLLLLVLAPLLDLSLLPATNPVLAVPLLAALVLVATRYAATGDPALGLGLGACTGAALLAHPAAVVAVPFVAALALLRRPSRHGAAVAAGALALAAAAFLALGRDTLPSLPQALRWAAECPRSPVGSSGGQPGRLPLAAVALLAMAGAGAAAFLPRGRRAPALAALALGAGPLLLLAGLGALAGWPDESHLRVMFEFPALMAPVAVLAPALGAAARRLPRHRLPAPARAAAFPAALAVATALALALSGSGLRLSAGTPAEGPPGPVSGNRGPGDRPPGPGGAAPPADGASPRGSAPDPAPGPVEGLDASAPPAFLAGLRAAAAAADPGGRLVLDSVGGDRDGLVLALRWDGAPLRVSGLPAPDAAPGAPAGAFRFRAAGPDGAPADLPAPLADLLAKAAASLSRDPWVRGAPPPPPADFCAEVARGAIARSGGPGDTLPLPFAGQALLWLVVLGGVGAAVARALVLPDEGPRSS